MSIKTVNTKNAPEALGPYSHATMANGFIFISGQIPIDPKTSEIVSGIENQTEMALANCQAVLKECGASFNDVMKVSIFISDMNNFATINEIYSKYFSEHKPARACVEVARLPKDVMIEIEMTAFKA